MPEVSEKPYDTLRRLGQAKESDECGKEAVHETAIRIAYRKSIQSNPALLCPMGQSPIRSKLLTLRNEGIVVLK